MNFIKAQINQVSSIGGLHFKFKSTVNGVPDQIIIYDKNIYLVEVKRPDETPRKSQIVVHNKIKDQGVDVYVLDTKEKIDQFIKKTLNAEPIEIEIPEKVTIRSKKAFKLE